jgi:mRNA interferase MazF
MKSGIMPKSGDIVLTTIQFTDSFEIKKRPALILYEEFGNIVVAGITSNSSMEGIKLTKKEGMIKDSVIKLNYLFTISAGMIHKTLFSISREKKTEVYHAIVSKFSQLKMFNNQE